MPLTATGLLVAVAKSAPEDCTTILSDWVKLSHVEQTLRVVLRTMAEFDVLVL